ncbi:RING-H2 finger protein ATL52-like [Durio zibethinus]|uniref:RING-type E3 ubiquitin transferase n=1 Tax=Durio zibethinus TaxID=66656 RepID=A0A6P5YUJ6_DURZI|nr:RING-H2 finger protein ATL52-like [Durio zibethinus]
MDEGHHGFRFNPILVGLFGVIAGAIMVATYHLVFSICNCCRRQMLDTANTRQNVQHIQQERPSDRNRGISTPRLIPIFKYSKDCNEDMCAICLGDLKEGEQIRVLPDCLHFFHVACIDTWLNLHSNCPLCRADTSSLPEQVAVSLPDSSRTPPLELSRLPDFGV